MKRLVGLILCAAAACGEGDPRPATWSYIHSGILVPNCARCHNVRDRVADIDLSTERGAYRSLVDRRLIVTGDANSALTYLLEGIERPRMPPDAPLPKGDIDLIRRWLESGAKP